MNPAEFLAFLARTSLAAGVLVVLVLATQRVFRRQLSPFWNCALWLLVFARLLPFSLSSGVSLFNFVPAWTQPSRPAAPPSPARPAQFALPPGSSTAPTPAGALPPVPVAPAVATAATTESRWAPLRRDPGIALFWLWFAGAVTLAVAVGVSTVALARATARATAVADSDVLARLRDCGVAMRVRRVPRLMESSAVATPALHGLLRPQILLPPGFTTRFSAAEQRYVFLHELAHLRRGDLWLNWLITSLQVLHWFNPLVWLAAARWRTDREIACDAAALEVAGAESARGYGETILRLLDNFTAPARRPGLVGILEDHRQLHRRMHGIARFTPARRPFAAIGMLAILGLVGLTDAQVATPPPSTATRSTQTAAAKPPPETRANTLDEAIAAEIATRFNGDRRAFLDYLKSRGLTQREYRREVESELRTRGQLPPDGAGTARAPERPHVLFLVDSETRAELVMQSVQAFAAHQPSRVASFSNAAQLNELVAGISSATTERIVLLTGGLPRPAPHAPAAPDAEKAFRELVAHVPPRIPVHVGLLPTTRDESGAAGLYWGLAQTTRGQLVVPAPAASAPRTHLAFVVDTSGSMRDPATGALWPGVLGAIEATLDAQPHLAGVQLLDGDGRFILGRKGNGANGWLPNTPATRDALREALRNYKQDTVSNPIPGVANAIRFLHGKTAAVRMGVYIVGDEFNSSDDPAAVLDRIATLNPPDPATGQRAITISAIGLPTTIRAARSIGNTGARFADLMRRLVQEHEGSFVGLADL